MRHSFLTSSQCEYSNRGTWKKIIQSQCFVLENKRFSILFANGPIKFKLQLCNRWLKTRLNLPNLTGNSLQIYECYWSVCKNKTWESFVLKKRCDWIIFFQMPQFEQSHCNRLWKEITKSWQLFGCWIVIITNSCKL